MTADELEARVTKLISEALDAGMEKGTVIGVLHDVAETLQEEQEEQKP